MNTVATLPFGQKKVNNYKGAVTLFEFYLQMYSFFNRSAVMSGQKHL